VKTNAILSRGLLALVLFLPLTQTFGQTATAPFFTITDFASDGTTSPLLLLTGGQTSSTVGAEVTSQSTSTTTTNLPNLGAIMGTGHGGLSLIQTSPATSSGTTLPAAGQDSPFFCISGNQWIGDPTDATRASAWCLQVQGGNVSDSRKTTADVIQWTRPTGTGYGNPTGDITMLFPGAINLAAAGQITVGPNVSATQDVSNILSTFTGQKTTNNGISGAPAAGSVTLEPGQLTASDLTASSGAGFEGALQILQSYIMGASADVGRLACPEATVGRRPQYITDCTSTGAAENWVGVFNSINGNQGVTVTPLRYGRVPISTTATNNVAFNAGDFVCKDDGTGGYVVTNGTTPCPIGESIGVAVGESSAPMSKMHLVDLVPEASVSGAAGQGQILQFTCIGAVATTASTIFLNGGQCTVGSGSDNTEFTLPYPSGSYTFSQMYVNYGHAGLTNDTVTLFVDGTSTNVTCSPTTTGQCSDPTHTASISGGHPYSIRVATQASDPLKNINVTIRLQ
jgi:hypothetical protein